MSENNFTPEEDDAIMNFVAEKAKKRKSPFVMEKLWGEYIGVSKTSRSEEDLTYRFKEFLAPKLHMFKEFDNDTKIRILFATRIPLKDDGFLKKLRKSSDVLHLNILGQIVKYREKIEKKSEGNSKRTRKMLARKAKKAWNYEESESSESSESETSEESDDEQEKEYRKQKKVALKQKSPGKAQIVEPDHEAIGNTFNSKEPMQNDAPQNLQDQEVQDDNEMIDISDSEIISSENQLIQENELKLIARMRMKIEPTNQFEIFEEENYAYLQEHEDQDSIRRNLLRSIKPEPVETETPFVIVLDEDEVAPPRKPNSSKNILTNLQNLVIFMGSNELADLQEKLKEALELPDREIPMERMLLGFETIFLASNPASFGNLVEVTSCKYLLKFLKTILNNLMAPELKNLQEKVEAAIEQIGEGDDTTPISNIHVAIDVFFNLIS